MIKVINPTLISDDNSDVIFFFPKDFKTLTFAEAEAWLQKHKREDKSFYEALKEALK